MTDGEENLVVSRAGPRGGARGRDQPLRRRAGLRPRGRDRKSTRLNSSHSQISYAVFCLKKKKCEFNGLNFNRTTFPRDINHLVAKAFPSFPEPTVALLADHTTKTGQFTVGPMTPELARR